MCEFQWNIIRKALLVSVLWGILLFDSYAGDQVGRITRLNVRAADGLHWVYLDGVHNNKPACASKHDYWMVKDETSEVGKTQISLLLTAFASEKTISISGLNTCTRWGDGEDINTISIFK